MATRKNKATNYFSHDSNARNDEKILQLRMKHKAAGYGVYFMILERLREDNGYMSVKDYNMIAFDLRVDASLVKSVVEDFGLFVFTDDGKYFYSESFKQRMDKKDTLRHKLSEAGRQAMKKRWEKKKTTAKQQETEPSQSNEPQPQSQPQPEHTAPKPTDNDKTYITRFFRKENRENIEVLLMNFGMKPDDITKLRKFAKEVVAEWKATDTTHQDYTDWSRHMIATMRIKCAEARKAETKRNATKEPKEPKEQKPPAADDYTFDGGFGSQDI